MRPRGYQLQPQAPPQQPPPDGPRSVATPPTATVESSFTVSSCPLGHVQGADDSLIGRVRSNVSPQARHRYSYLGTAQSYRQKVPAVPIVRIAAGVDQDFVASGAGRGASSGAS